MRFAPVSIELDNKTTNQHFHDLRRRHMQKMCPEETPETEKLDTELQSSPKLNCSVQFPLLSTDTPLQSPVEQPSFVEPPSSNEPAMKVTFKQRLHGLKRHIKPIRAQHVLESERIDPSYKLTAKATVRQFLQNLKHHAKKMCPESGNTVEPQTSSSITGCKLKQVRSLLPRLVQCPDKTPETGHISCVEPSRPKFSFELDDLEELDEGVSFVWPQRLPEQPNPTYGLRRVPTPHPLAPTDTPPQSPLEYISLAELQDPETESICGLDLLPPSFPRPNIDTPPASPKFDTRTKAVSFAELPRPDKSYGLKRVPTPFPKNQIDTPFQSFELDNKRTTTISFAELPHSTNNCELKRVPTPFPLPPTTGSLPQKPVGNIENDNLIVDTRRFAWYGPPDFFPNARRNKVAYPAETRQYVRPMDFLRNGHSVVGVG